MEKLGLMTKTPQEMAEDQCNPCRTGDNRAIHSCRVYLAGLAEGKRLGLEEAAKLFENGFGWPGSAAAIRALLPKDAPSAGERG